MKNMLLVCFVLLSIGSFSQQIITKSNKEKQKNRKFERKKVTAALFIR
jgi:hypothetical protein